MDEDKQSELKSSVQQLLSILRRIQLESVACGLLPSLAAALTEKGKEDVALGTENAVESLISLLSEDPAGMHAFIKDRLDIAKSMRALSDLQSDELHLALRRARAASLEVKSIIEQRLKEQENPETQTP